MSRYLNHSQNCCSWQWSARWLDPRPGFSLPPLVVGQCQLPCYCGCHHRCWYCWFWCQCCPLDRDWQDCEQVSYQTEKSILYSGAFFFVLANSWSCFLNLFLYLVTDHYSSKLAHFTIVRRIGDHRHFFAHKVPNPTP